MKFTRSIFLIQLYLIEILRLVLADDIIMIIINYLADLTVSERPGTSFQIEIHFTVLNRLYILFSFMKFVET